VITHGSLIAALAILVVVSGGCGQKTAKTEEPAAPTPTATAPTPGQLAAQEQRPPAETSTAPQPHAVATSPRSGSGPPSTPAPQSVSDITDEPALKDVFFNPGHADIGRNGARIVKDSARWILDTVTISCSSKATPTTRGVAKATSP
jgi:hypothetical protein